MSGEEQASPESEGARRLRKTRVGEFWYSQQEWEQLPAILKHRLAPSRAIRQAIEAQRRRRLRQAGRVEA